MNCDETFIRRFFLFVKKVSLLRYTFFHLPIEL